MDGRINVDQFAFRDTNLDGALLINQRIGNSRIQIGPGIHPLYHRIHLVVGNNRYHKSSFRLYLRQNALCHQFKAQFILHLPIGAIVLNPDIGSGITGYNQGLPFI